MMNLPPLTYPNYSILIVDDMPVNLPSPQYAPRRRITAGKV
jgi:hypothetical protein